MVLPYNLFDSVFNIAYLNIEKMKAHSMFVNDCKNVRTCAYFNFLFHGMECFFFKRFHILSIFENKFLSIREKNCWEIYICIFF